MGLSKWLAALFPSKKKPAPKPGTVKPAAAKPKGTIQATGTFTVTKEPPK